MKLFTLLLACAAVSFGYSEPDHVKPIPIVRYTPGTCDFGEMILRLDLSAGSNIFTCGLSNNWVIVGGGASGTAGGDLSGTYPDPTVTKINGAAFTSASLNDQANTPSLTPGDAVVDLSGTSFTDELSATSTTTINVGQTVSWKWVSGLHTVVSLSALCGADPCASLEDKRFDSGDPNSTVGHRFSYTFTSPGTYHYYCDVHGQVMQGTVVVAARLSPALFSDIGTCSAAGEGTSAPVTDSMTDTWGATITGSGSSHVLAYCDGTSWTVAAK